MNTEWNYFWVARMIYLCTYIHFASPIIYLNDKKW